MVDLVTDGKHMIFNNCKFTFLISVLRCQTRTYVTLPTDSGWKLQRGILQRMLTKESIVRYEPVQMAEVTQLMFDLLVDPEVLSLDLTACFCSH